MGVLVDKKLSITIAMVMMALNLASDPPSLATLV
jgi:hypothetical protein